MTTTDTDTARRYAGTIADELHALETVASGHPRGYDPDAPENDDDEMSDYRAALAELELDYSRTDDAIAIYLNETTLDVTIYRAENDRDTARVEILRTCGGPRCEISWDTNSGQTLTVDVWWGSDQARTTVWAPVIVDYLEMVLS